MSEVDGREASLRVAVKRELRKRMRGVRATLPAAAVAARSAAIVEAIEALEVFRGARSVALFWPIEGRNEVDLRVLGERALSAGKRVGFPWADVEANVCRLKWVERLDELVAGPMGFDEPPTEAPVASRGEVDVVVVPALAIDPRGHRIGYGRGFYDRLLPAYAPPAVAIGVAFDFQLVAEVPETAGDVAVDVVVTDAGVLRDGGEAAGGEGLGVRAAVMGVEGVRRVVRPSRGG